MNDSNHMDDSMGRVPSRGVRAGSGDPAYRNVSDVVGRVPPRGEGAGSGDPAYKGSARPVSASGDPPPRRLRRLHRVWPDREGNISYLLTICVDGRKHVLDNDVIFERFIAFLLDSPTRYHWFGRRFVVMPDHIHLVAHMGQDAVRIGQWIKALKAVVGGFGVVGRVPSRGDGARSGDPACKDPAGPVSATNGCEGTRIKRPWRWQAGFHDHKFRTPESETRKWEYVCLNPVRASLVQRPEEWPYCGEIVYHESEQPKLIRGTPPLFEKGMMIEEPDESAG